MSNIILANLESPLLDALNKTSKTDLRYELTDNYPNLAINKYVISPNPVGATTGTDVGGSTITFQLPRNGILCGLIVESTIATAGNNNASVTGDANRTQPAYLGLSLYSRIDLLSNNVTLATCSDAYLRCRAETGDMSTGLRAKKMSKVFSTDKFTLATTWSNASVVTFTPVYFSIFERVEQMLDLSFVQNLILQLTVNTYTNMGLAAAITSVTPYVHAKYFTLGANDILALRAKNYGSANPYMALSYSTYTETGQLTDSQTTVNLYPQCQNAVFRTHVFLKNRTYNSLLAIKNITLSMGGVNIMASIPTVVMQQEQEGWQGSGLLSFDQYQTTQLGSGSVSYPVVYMGRGDNEPVTIYWGLSPSRTFNSGAVSYHNITNFQITLTTASTSSTDYYLVHEFWQLLAVNASSGDVSVSASS
jgi:hypothetical protein